MPFASDRRSLKPTDLVSSRRQGRASASSSNFDCGIPVELIAEAVRVNSPRTDLIAAIGAEEPVLESSKVLEPANLG